jgi:lysine 2,3-aminomutase
MSKDETRPPHRGTARRASELLEAGAIQAEQVAEVDKVSEAFSLAVTPEMLELMDPKDQDDPIARQFIPRAEELTVLPAETADPIGDDTYEIVKGIIHRYPDRLILKVIHVCPVYCRFCFRREKVGPGNELLSAVELDEAFNYIRSQPQVWEVILSGGDPLMLSEGRLTSIIQRLDAIEHIEVIRIHTRVPVADPSRVTPGVVRALKVSKPVYVVLHCNHPRELTDAARTACAALVDAGIPMLSQSVLLKGVNNDPAVLGQLFRAFIRARVKPYYLHHGDLARGTSHFRTTIVEGQELMRCIRGRVSGICQPIYVLDIPGGFGKVPIGPDYLSPGDSDGEYLVEDFHGVKHVYPPRS